MSLAGLVCHLDFSGRCNRRGLLVIAVVLLALQLLLATIVWLAGVPGSHPFVQLLQFVFFWLSLAAAAKRLHDCGLSAWWLLAGALGLMGCCFIVTIAAVALLGPMTLAPGNLGFIVAIAVTMALGVAMTTWLHLMPGMARDNLYGPTPDESGFSRPLRARTSAPAVHTHASPAT